jgi:hypothetical protein
VVALHASAALSLGKEPGVCVGPTVGVDILEKSKRNKYATTGINKRGEKLKLA